MWNYGKSKIVLLWPRFGPYHIARLSAAQKAFSERGMKVIGVEIATKDSAYAWEVTKVSKSLDKITLFPGTNYHELDYMAINTAVKNALKRIDPLAVATVGWSFPEARAALVWCRRNSCKAIAMSASKRDDISRRWWCEILKQRIVRQFDAALVGGKPQAKYAAELGLPLCRIFMGYDAVDNEFFANEVCKVLSERNRFRKMFNLPAHYFLAVVRFIPEKNLERFLRAYAAYFHQEQQPWGLVLAGSGKLEPKLKALSYQLGLSKIYWPGFVQIGDLPKYYALASAFILPSVKETWGLVVNEAMASGLPVLVSKTVGCRYDLVEDGSNGFLFDPYCVEDMAKVMVRMSRTSGHKRRQMGVRSQEIVANWGPQRFAEGLWQAVVSVLNSDPPFISVIDKIILNVYDQEGRLRSIL